MKAYLFSSDTDELCLYRLMGIEGSRVTPEELADTLKQCVRSGEYALVIVAAELAERAGLRDADLPQGPNCLCAVLPREGFFERLTAAVGNPVTGGQDGQH